jgi:NNP family nitrate/nitrite transporter-like MFS transporter
MLLAALGLGLAGGGFAVGVAYVSKWYPQEKQGSALGFFGMGNVGAAVTKFVAPWVMVAMGWEAVAQIWAAALTAIAVCSSSWPRMIPSWRRARRSGVPPQSLKEQLEPLHNEQVWRFSLYYFFVFGAFVALALWLPKYLIGVYGVDIKVAGMLGATFSLSASLFRAYGGILSDRYGARKIMYATFGVSMLCLFMLSYPATDYVDPRDQGRYSFRHLDEPGALRGDDLRARLLHVAGQGGGLQAHPGLLSGSCRFGRRLVGLVGGLGGFVLPIVFGAVSDLTGIWTSCFMVLFALVAIALAWMHWRSGRWSRKRRASTPAVAAGVPGNGHSTTPRTHSAHAAGKLLTDWRPEDPAFWEADRQPIARRNL